jgi:NADH:ubiquinone oxidoreductase subunit E
MIIDTHNIKKVLGKSRSDRGQLIMILQNIQQEFHYLPKESIREVAKYLNIPQSTVYSAATFYKSFSLIPRGENIIKVCKGTACHIKGADLIIDQLDAALGIRPGQTTEDMKYTIEVVNCVGACAMAPVMIVNNKYFGEVKCSRAARIAKKG